MHQNGLLQFKMKVVFKILIVILLTSVVLNTILLTKFERSTTVKTDNLKFKIDIQLEKGDRRGDKTTATTKERTTLAKKTTIDFDSLVRNQLEGRVNNFPTVKPRLKTNRISRFSFISRRRFIAKQRELLESTVHAVPRDSSRSGSLPWDRILSMKSIGEHSFNKTASDLTPLRRNVTDTRPKLCKTRLYDIHSLPTVSVIIPFHNEAISTLLRTVHSFLDKTPSKLLVEVIMVDDASTVSYLHEPLTDYVAHLPKVSVIRLKERSGLMVARTTGARAARGDILFLVDSHAEANFGWYEPLATRIKEKRNAVIVPIVDLIKYNTFIYTRPNEYYHGTFTWDLDYTWKRMPKYLKVNIEKDPFNPIPDPAMVGCAFGIDKRYFFELGAYDLSMEIWGGENIEHSFRIWMCGGSLEILPCCRVGHVYKPKLPYKFIGNPYKTIQRNRIRTAEVWMDDYKHSFYSTQLGEIEPVELESLAQRKQLRRDLKCRDFQWFLDNIAPDVLPPPSGAVKYGYMKHYWSSDNCLNVDLEKRAIIIDSCGNQFWDDDSFAVTDNGRFMWRKHCFSVSPGTSALTLHEKCDSPSMHQWEYYDFMVRHKPTDRCVALNAQDKSVTLDSCDFKDKRVKWSFRYTMQWNRTVDINKVVEESVARPPGALQFGSVYNLGSHSCLQALDSERYNMVPCQKLKPYEKTIHLTRNGQLMYRNYCFQVNSKLQLTVKKCNEAHQTWAYDTTNMYLTVRGSGLCLVEDTDTQHVLLGMCDNSTPNMKWNFSSP